MTGLDARASRSPWCGATSPAPASGTHVRAPIGPRAGLALLVVASSVLTWLAPPAGSAAVPGAAALTVPAEPVRAGSAVDVAGRGFLLAEPSSCQATWSGQSSAPPSCTLDGHVRALLVLSEEHPLGPHDLRLCTPSCAGPWAGESTVSIVVVAPEPIGAPGRAGSGLGQAAASPALPPTGPAGAGDTSAVAAVAPQEADVFPQRPSPGDQVQVSVPDLPVPPDTNTTCELQWDDAPARSSCEADPDGLLRGEVQVPDAARPGDHEVRACRPGCADAVAGIAVSTVRVALTPPPSPPSPVVTRPPPARVDPPPVTSTPTPVKGTPTLPPVTTTPPGVTSAPPPSRLTTASPAPVLVPVPDLGDMDLPALRRLLTSATLSLGTITGSGRVVEQTPAPGQLVPAGSAVAVRLAELPAEPVPVSVEDAPTWTAALAALALGVVALLAGWAAAALRSRAAAGPGGLAAPRVVPHPDPVPTVSVEVHGAPPEQFPRIEIRSTPDRSPTTCVEVSHDNAR